MPKSPYTEKKKSYGYGSVSDQMKDVETPGAPIEPVMRDMGIDKHIGYQEISPNQASKSEVEKPLDEMTIDEIIARSKKKK